jgi:DNA-binding MarR family transcriptional regulator
VRTDPPNGIPPAELDLADLVMRVARALRRRGAEATAPWGLAPHHARALRVLSHNGHARPGELAVRLRITPRSVTDVVDSLEERGLVIRRPDPADRRATALSLTMEGERLVEEIDAATRDDARAYFGLLDEGDRQALRRILAALDAAG